MQNPNARCSKREKLQSAASSHKTPPVVEPPGALENVSLSTALRCYSAQQSQAQAGQVQSQTPVSPQSDVQMQASQAQFAPQQQSAEERVGLGAKTAKTAATIKLKNIDMIKPFA